MKGFTKICLLLSLICLCIGAVCLGAGVALGSGIKEVWSMVKADELSLSFDLPYFFTDDDDADFGNMKKGLVDKKFPAEQVTNLNIDLKYGSINFVDSKSDQIEIYVDASDKNTYLCELDGDTLDFLDKTSRHIRNAILKGGYKADVTIAIPEGKIFDEADLNANAGAVDIVHKISAEKIHIELDAGQLTAERLSASEELSVNIGAGKFEVSDFSAQSLSVDCGIGSASLTGSLLQDADIECGMGEILLNLQGRESDYNYDVDCDLGSVYLNGNEYRSISLEKEIDNDAERDINLKCGMGNIDVTVKEE